jgi:hypothetical protein
VVGLGVFVVGVGVGVLVGVLVGVRVGVFVVGVGVEVTVFVVGVEVTVVVTVRLGRDGTDPVGEGRTVPAEGVGGEAEGTAVVEGLAVVGGVVVAGVPPVSVAAEEVLAGFVVVDVAGDDPPTTARPPKQAPTTTTALASRTGRVTTSSPVSVAVRRLLGDEGARTDPAGHPLRGGDLRSSFDLRSLAGDTGVHIWASHPTIARPRRLSPE